MRLHAPLLLSALAATWSCATLPTSYPGSGSTTATPAGGSTAADIVATTNAARARNGLPALASSARLMDAARIQAGQMASFQQASHTITRAQYPTMESRLAAVGYSYTSAAENIAWNQQSAQEAVTSWMNSAGHRANMLDPNFTEMGAAVARSSRGEPYWVQVFGRPR